MISVYIDTNCINARQNDQYINKLEELYEQDKILVEKADTLDTELQGKSGYPKGQRKSLSYIESYGPAVLGHSRLGYSILGDDQDDQRLGRILEILFGKKVRSAYSYNEIRDAMHIATAIRYGGTYFITTDTDLLKRADLIESEFGLKIRNPKDCLQEIEDRLRVIAAL